MDSEERHRLQIQQIVVLTESYSYKFHEELMALDGRDDAITVSPQLALLTAMHSALHLVEAEAKAWEIWATQAVTSGDDAGAHLGAESP